MSHQQLKIATEEHHKNLETEMYVYDLMNNSLNLIAYKHLIICNYLVFKQINAYLNSTLNAQIFALQKDLEELKIYNLKDFLLKMPKFDLSKFSHENVLGYKYVILGSALGASIIEKKLKENAELKNYSHHFYKAQKQININDWKSLCIKLDQQSETTTNKIIIEANKLFVYYIELIKKIKEFSF